MSSQIVARTVAVVLLLGLTVIHVATLPRGFDSVAYVGVMLIMAAGMAAVGAGILISSNATAAWIYALAEGALNATGYLVSRLGLLPFTDQAATGQWQVVTALALVCTGTALVVVSGRVLTRRVASHRRHPVTPMGERTVFPPGGRETPADLDA